MHDYQKIITLSKELIASVDARDGLLMQQKVDALELAYKKEFGDSLNGYVSFKAFVMMNLASAKYFAYNNMFALVHRRYQEVADRMDGFPKSRSFNSEQKKGGDNAL